MQLQSQSSHPTRKSFKLLCLIAGGLCFFILIGIYQLLVTQEHLSDNPRIPQKVSRKQLEQSFVEASHLQNLSVANRSNVGYGLGGFRNPALVVFCYNREEYLGKTLEALTQVPGLETVTVYVSQDGYENGTEAIAKQYVAGELGKNSKHAEFWQHERRPLLGDDQPGHAWLSQHYKWGLEKIFKQRSHSHAIILEDDMIVSQDFISYMTSLAPLLDSDPSLWCISSWNDNGVQHLDWKIDKLFRTSYFPGLGWMLRKELWDEIGESFPLQAWDHWMRLNRTSKGRECIVPEVNRNRNIGEIGANMQTSTFKRYLGKMSWAEVVVTEWGNLDHLMLQNYTDHLANYVARAQIWEGKLTMQSLRNVPVGQVWLIPYLGENYLRIARIFRIWPFPRGHHRHLTIIPYKGSTFILADQRFCSMLPKSLRVLPSPNITAYPGNQSLDCDETCRSVSLECKKEDFWFINTCEHLMQHFPCERGCLTEIGPDVPNYVVNKNLSTYQACLVTQKQSFCGAAFNGTRRLCPCS